MALFWILLTYRNLKQTIIAYVSWTFQRHFFQSSVHWMLAQLYKLPNTGNCDWEEISTSYLLKLKSFESTIKCTFKLHISSDCFYLYVSRIKVSRNHIASAMRSSQGPLQWSIFSYANCFDTGLNQITFVSVATELSKTWFLRLWERKTDDFLYSGCPG